MKTVLQLCLVFVCFTNAIFSQSPGDVIKVQAFTFDNNSREMVLDFPDDPNLKFQKIELRYKMRCKDGLISTVTDRNKGCGEWDYTNNTYIIDEEYLSEEVDSADEYILTNYNQNSISYVSEPVYDLKKENLSVTEVLSSANEVDFNIGNGSESLENVLPSKSNASRSQFIVTANELSNLGLTAGPISALGLDVLSSSATLNFLKIKLKHTSASSFSQEDQSEDVFQEVYYNSLNFDANSKQQLFFHTPFTWDGSSNIIVDLSFSNLGNTSSENLKLKGSIGNMPQGKIYDSESKSIYFGDEQFIDVSGYKGINSDQNATIEFWIKTKQYTGALCSWGDRSQNGAQLKMYFGKPRFILPNGKYVRAEQTINDNQWHHVAFVVSGKTLGDVTIYIDGESISTSGYKSEAINFNLDSDYDFRIGNAKNGNNELFLNKSSLDQFRIWSKDLTQSEIKLWKDLRVGQSHPSIGSLELNYDFEGTGNFSITDNSNNQRNGTIGAAVRVDEGDGNGIVKEFERVNFRPNITFYKGDYNINVQGVSSNKNLYKTDRIFVFQKYVISNAAENTSDELKFNEAYEVWLPSRDVFDYDGSLLTTEDLVPDASLSLNSKLVYYNRLPTYHQIVSFVSPYGINTDLDGLNGEYWTFDLTDFAPILRGQKTLIMPLVGNRQEQMDLEFLFYVGTPSRDVIDIRSLWQSTYKHGGHGLRHADLKSDYYLNSKEVKLNANADYFKIVSSITGHGSDGEFQGNGGVINHKLSVNNTEVNSWSIHTECSNNPLIAQGGTWLFDRQGWCPGVPTHIEETDITANVTPGQTVILDYNISDAEKNNGEYKYHQSHHLVEYGAYNFNTDATIKTITNPTADMFYRKETSFCKDASVLIQNSGASPITNLVIEYWINDTMQPAEFEWTGILNASEEVEVILPYKGSIWNNLRSESLGNYFKAKIKTVNGSKDQYELNDFKSAEFSFPNVHSKDLRVWVRTNERPWQNRVQITDATSGEIVYDKSYSISNFSYNENLTLDSGCYNFRITDSGQDGLQHGWSNQGNGQLYLFFGNEHPLYVSDFGSSFNYAFTTDYYLSKEELDFVTGLSIYPNPVIDNCNIKASSNLIDSVSIFNLQGQEIKRINNNQPKANMTLNLSDLTSGNYFVNITGSGITTTRKILKK
ncbi:MAG: LamG-like jellyroll fold domain-containing protein [Flavobacteriaceae bacterium]